MVRQGVEQAATGSEQSSKRTPFWRLRMAISATYASSSLTSPLPSASHTACDPIKKARNTVSVTVFGFRWELCTRRRRSRRAYDASRTRPGEEIEATRELRTEVVRGARVRHPRQCFVRFAGVGPPPSSTAQEPHSHSLTFSERALTCFAANLRSASVSAMALDMSLPASPSPTSVKLAAAVVVAMSRVTRVGCCVWRRPTVVVNCTRNQKKNRRQIIISVHHPFGSDTDDDCCT